MGQSTRVFVAIGALGLGLIVGWWLIAAAAGKDSEVAGRLANSRNAVEKGWIESPEVIAALESATPESLHVPRIVEARVVSSGEKRTILVNWLATQPKAEAIRIDAPDHEPVTIAIDTTYREENRREAMTGVVFRFVWTTRPDSSTWRNIKPMLESGKASVTLLRDEKPIGEPAELETLQPDTQPEVNFGRYGANRIVVVGLLHLPELKSAAASEQSEAIVSALQQEMGSYMIQTFTPGMPRPRTQPVAQELAPNWNMLVVGSPLPLDDTAVGDTAAVEAAFRKFDKPVVSGQEFLKELDITREIVVKWLGRRLKRRLADDLPMLNLEEIPLADVVGFLRDVQGVTISVHWRQLAGHGIDQETPLTLKMNNAPFAAVNARVAGSLGDGKATFLIHNGHELVLTAETEAQRLLRKQPLNYRRIRVPINAERQHALETRSFPDVHLKGTLGEVLDTFEQFASDLVVDWPAFRQAGVGPAREVSISSSEIGAADMLRQILRAAGVKDPVVIAVGKEVYVTTEARKNALFGNAVLLDPVTTSTRKRDRRR
ncbi:MAG: hypothetical protein ACLFVU_07390 [Phycisphaerae bacterium]